MQRLSTRTITLSANLATGELNPQTPAVKAGAADTSPAGTIATGSPSNEELEAPPQIGGAAMVLTLLVSLGLAIAIFFLGPLFLANLLHNQIGTGWLNLIFEGGIRLALLVGY